jgi:hypothetical protein
MRKICLENRDHYTGRQNLIEAIERLDREAFALNFLIETVCNIGKACPVRIELLDMLCIERSRLRLARIR